MGQDDVIYVGSDDGFRQTKIVTSTGFKLSIPSIAKAGFTLSAIDSNEDGLGGYETDGRQFTVDSELDGEDTRFDGYAFSEINRVIVNHALQLAGLGGRRIALATGVPFSSYFMPGSSEVNQDLLDQKMNNLSVEVLSLNGAKAPVIVKQNVMAQGLAAFVDYLTDDQGNIRDGLDPEQPVAILDIGGRTTDTVTIYGGNRVDHSASGTGNIGISNVYDHIKNAILRKYGVDKIRLATLERVARDRRIRLRGEDHDLSDIVREGVEKVWDQILREIKRSIGDAAEMGAVILVGGGANLMSDLVAKSYPHLYVPEEPEFANARGMLKGIMYMDD